MRSIEKYIMSHMYYIIITYMYELIQIVYIYDLALLHIELLSGYTKECELMLTVSVLTQGLIP